MRTPLYDEHILLNGKIVPFAGFELPVQYQKGIIAEHMAVRTRVGMFDVSHMGEILLKGADALANLNRLCTNDFTNLAVGRARYTPLCAEDGGAIDDLLIYKFSDEKYMIVANASNVETVFEHVKTSATGDVRVTNISADTAQIAVQGPMSAEILSKLYDALPQKNYSFIMQDDCIISRTGYTGEDGFEIYCPPKDAPGIWQKLLEAGVEPCGLGARDTLRLEAAMPLYGHELTRDITPQEAGLGMFIKLEKPDFVGKSALTAMPNRRRIGLRITGRGIAREGYRVAAEGIDIGYVTSGAPAPYLGYPIAMALVDAAAELTDLAVIIRDKSVVVEVVGLPFYKKKKSEVVP